MGGDEPLVSVNLPCRRFISPPAPQHEVNDSIVHVIEWHYLAMPACGLVGLWLGKQLLKW